MGPRSVLPWVSRTLAVLWKAVDPLGDRGDGELRECECCGKLRHDINESGFCRPCDNRLW